MGNTRGIKSFTSDSRYYGAFNSVGELIFANEDGYIYQLEITNGFDSTKISIYESPYMPIQDQL